MSVSEARSIIESARKEGRKVLLEPEAKQICRLYGLPVTNFRVARTVDEVLKCAKEVAYPVAVKIVAPQILHKSDCGGVVVGINNDEELRPPSIGWSATRRPAVPTWMCGAY